VSDPVREPVDAASFRQDDTRETYDRVARRYADEIATELGAKPFDRAFLDDYARAVMSLGRVVELGCGPAHVAAYLATRGVTVSGLDLSPNMVEQAGRLFPGLEVVVGDMLDLPFDDGSLGGVVAFYSIIHFHDGQLARAFSEMARALIPGGLAALAFHVGDEVLHRTEWWGQAIVLDARFLPTEHIAELLREQGFELTTSTEREPYAPGVEYQSRRAYLVARRV
jgi:SAM-dependent methyltransferase